MREANPGAVQRPSGAGRGAGTLILFPPRVPADPIRTSYFA
jgi:hypothetical protein